MADLKKIIRQEYIKCVKNPIHFMKKYCYIQHPQRGRISFSLYPFQEKVLGLFKENPYSVILKSRQLGISTLTAGYSLWMMIFHKDKNILCIATKQDTAKNMVTKVKFMYENLPSWLKVDAMENNKLTLRLNNGSQIKATSASSDAGRSEAVSLLLIEFQKQERILLKQQIDLHLDRLKTVDRWYHKPWVGFIGGAATTVLMIHIIDYSLPK